MGHVKLKARSLGQVLEKPCLHSRGHIFSSIIMKLCQNHFLDEIWDKTRSQGQMLEKPCVRSRGHIFLSDNHETWSEL